MAPSNLELAYFQEQLIFTQKMEKVLHYSFQKVKPVIELLETNNGNAEISQEQAEMLEALTARFARLSDILIQKLFRATDALELTDEGSLIDRINRMEKRGIIKNAQEWLELRKLRNQIAHDYVLEDLIPLYQSVFHQCKILLSAVDAIVNYAAQKGWDSKPQNK